MEVKWIMYVFENAYFLLNGKSPSSPVSEKQFHFSFKDLRELLVKNVFTFSECNMTKELRLSRVTL